MQLANKRSQFRICPLECIEIERTQLVDFFEGFFCRFRLFIS